MENSVHGLPQTLLHYGSVWFRIGIAEQNLLEVSLIEFQQCPWNGLWDTWKGKFMIVCKVGFIFESIWLKIRTAPLPVLKVFHIQFLKYRLCGKVTRIYGRVHLWLCVNQLSFSINWAEDRNCLRNFSGSVPYRIRNKCVWRHRRWYYVADRSDIHIRRSF
jgi:hypothetical protein